MCIRDRIRPLSSAFRCARYSIAAEATHPDRSWRSTGAIEYLAQRKADDSGRIGDGATDSIAHLLSTYITDVDRIAHGVEGGGFVGPYTETHPTTDAVAKLPIGANFTVTSLNQVLGEVLLDESAMTQLADATASVVGCVSV